MVEDLLFIEAHPALRHVITGYYYANVSEVPDKLSLTPFSSGMLYYTLYLDDVEIDIYHQNNMKKSIFEGILHGQIDSPPTLVFYKKVNSISTEMYPIAMQSLFGFPALDLKNCIVSPDDLSLQNHDAFIDQLRHETSPEKIKNILDNYYLNKLDNNKYTQFFHYMYQMLNSSSGTIEIKDLQNKSGYSKRQCERIFKEVAGETASTMKRFIRCNTALKKIIGGWNIQDIIFQLKYTDQSHFIKDIKWYTSKTPQAISQKMNNNILHLGTSSLSFEHITSSSSSKFQ